MGVSAQGDHFFCNLHKGMGKPKAGSKMQSREGEREVDVAQRAQNGTVR